MSEATPTTTPVLAASGLIKRFRSGSQPIEVLAGVDLAVLPKQSLSIRGASGSGKTTLLNLLAGLESPDEGAVSWDGHELPARGLGRLARERADFLGMVFQAFYLVPELDALENVVLAARIARSPLGASRDRARALLERVGLGERLHSLPGQLSGGERQRVAVARALMNRPRVVLADEPTGNLDEHTADSVMDTLFALTAEEGASLILVTHHAGFAARCEEVWRLHLGRLEAGER